MKIHKASLLALAIISLSSFAVATAQDQSSASAATSSSSEAASSDASNVSSSTAPSSQGPSNVANIDPASVSTVSGVVAKCQIVADSQKGGAKQNPNSGLCIGATQIFLTSLTSQSPPLSDNDLDQQLTDLVTALVPLAQADPACNSVDDEIARAIKLASQFSKSNDQAAQIQTISTTVASCTVDQTAALSSAIVPSPAQ